MQAEDLYEQLLKCCEGKTAAIRAVTRLVPVGGPGDKVCPPTYEGGQYAFEDRLIDGQPVRTVLLDSVQSQANRLEELLLNAVRNSELHLPVFEITIPGHGTLTSLDVPHRVHDAIFRDSTWGESPFRGSPDGRRLVEARAWNATAFYEFCPTALLFGTWDSQSGAGVNSAKIPRALVSEIVGLHAVDGKRTASRIDPLGIKRMPRVIYRHATDMWTLDREQAVQTDGNPQLFGEDGKPSDINHGNVTPAITKEKVEKGRRKIEIPGGVTFREAQQTTVLSFTQLRRLHFPEGDRQPALDRNIAGRAVLAALALYAITLQWEDGYQLRSRCQLVPAKTPQLEFIGETTPGVEPFPLDSNKARATLELAQVGAEAKVLRWHSGPIKLTPTLKLLRLVQMSDQLTEVPEEE